MMRPVKRAPPPRRPVLILAFTGLAILLTAAAAAAAASAASSVSSAAAEAAGGERAGRPAAPDAPAELRCANEGGARVLEWSPVEGADYYHVYRGSDAAAPAWLATTPSTRLVDNETVDADDLSYWVSAVGEGGESSTVRCEGRRATLGALALTAGVVGAGVVATFILVGRP